MSPWSELVRLSSEPKRKPRRVRVARVAAPSLQGYGRIQLRLLALLKRHAATGREAAESLEHSYDCISATLSAMERDGLVRVVQMVRGPTNQPCRLYGLPLEAVT